MTQDIHPGVWLLVVVILAGGFIGAYWWHEASLQIPQVGLTPKQREAIADQVDTAVRDYLRPRIKRDYHLEPARVVPQELNFGDDSRIYTVVRAALQNVGPDVVMYRCRVDGNARPFHVIACTIEK